MKSLLRDSFRPIYYYIKSRKTRTYYRLLKKRRINTQNRIKSIKFLDYIFDIPDVESFVWQYKEIFIDKIYNFKSNKGDPIIFDCGTNVGTSLLFFSKLYPNSKIIGFEADNEIAEMCIGNMKRNKINNVKIINKAVWINNNGVFFTPDNADGGSILSMKNPKSIKIESIRLKDYIKKEEQIDFLKIDIEGAEFEVIKDCESLLSKINNIFIEYHSFINSTQNLSEILKILEVNNYRYYIQNEQVKNEPFINKSSKKNIDLQINIFAFKE